MHRFDASQECPRPIGRPRGEMLKRHHGEFVCRYVAVETAVSIVINVLISALFMFAVFGRTPLIDLWGSHGLAIDFIPQTFMISAMSVLVPTLIARKRVRQGVLAPRRSVTRRAYSSASQCALYCWLRCLQLFSALSVS